MTDRGGAEIITFYSYKGGTGRSMHLANVAWILASNGKRVLTVDWDLEAPGLHRYFRPFLIDKELTATNGLIELMWSFTDAAMTPVPEADRVQGWHEAYADFLPYTTTIRWAFPRPGRLDLLPAGKQGASYSRNVNAFNWQSFYDRLGGGVFLESVKARMRKEYDYVLIDSRTGVSDTAGICTVQMPDALVVCFTANNQSIEGCASIVQSVRAQWAADGRRSLVRQRIFPLLARVDGSEKDKLNARRAFARATFDPYVAAIAPNAIDEYWRDVEVPYVPWYSYEEVLAPFADKYKEKISILDSAEALARMLTGGEVTAAVRPSNDDRVHVLKQFAVVGEASPRPAVMHASDVEIPSPYPGMRPFAENEGGWFFGRDKELDDLVRRLDRGEREIYVIGPPGSGKSSLVQAGLLHTLGAGSSRLEQSFVVRTMRPGEQPTDRLAKVLEGDLATPAATVAALVARHPPAERVLVFVDQLEELFTLADEAEQQRFIATLMALRGESRCYLLLALRADFYGSLMDSDLWPDLAGRISRLEVISLRGSALAQAITGPAMRVGVHLEARLCDRLVADAAAEPGALPFVQETLRLLWGGRRRSTPLTLADYEALGGDGRSGFEAVIADRADALLRTLTVAQQTIAFRVLLRLVSFGEGRPDTRRQQNVEMLRSIADDEAEFSRVLQQLVDDRLVTFERIGEDDDALADLSHEALITAWPVLHEWITRRRTGEQRRRRLEARAGEWIARGRSAAGLLDPVELAEAEQWIQSDAARDLGYGASLRVLVAVSRSELDKTERKRRRRMLRPIAVAAAFLVIAVLGLVAWQQRQETHRLLGMTYIERGHALLLDGHPMQALPYLEAARTEGGRDQALRTLFAQTARCMPVATFSRHGASVLSAAFSPDGKSIVTASNDNTARVWDAATGKSPAAPLEHQGAVLTASFSPDGMRVVTASADKTARVWNAVTGKPVTSPFEHQGVVRAASFSPDGARVVTASADKTARVWDATTGKPMTAALEHRAAVVAAAFSPDGTHIVTASDDKTAQVWDTATGNPVTPRLEHQGGVLAASFSPDGTRVVTASADKTARVWDAATGKPVTSPLEHQGIVRAASFSPDGTRVVTASDDNTARVWDASSGKPATPPLEHHGAIYAASFSLDGTHVVTASNDKTARVWNATTGKPVTPFLEHQGFVYAAAFSRDGTRVVTASQDQTARVWRATVGTPVPPPLEHQGFVYTAAFSPNGTRVVTASYDNTARIWDTSTGMLVTPPLEHQGFVLAAAFSADGSHVVTASEDKTARVWNAATGEPVTPPLEHQGQVNTAAFSPDGTRVVTASFDNTAQVWDVATGKPVTPPFEHQGFVVAAVFSPDGTRVVTTSGDKTARVWDARTGKLVTPPLEHQGIVQAAAFSPDGTRVVTASFDKTAAVWDVATGKPVTPPLEHQGFVYDAEFSPDGTRVVTASADKTARVWDAVTGKPLSPPLDHEGQVTSAAFSPDGTRVVTASADKTARVWDAITGEPLSPPLEHQGSVRSAVFSPSGILVVTASEDKTARIWDVSFGDRTLADWSVIAEQSPYILIDGRLSLRPSAVSRDSGN